MKIPLHASFTILVSPLVLLAHIEIMALTAPNGGVAANRSGRLSFFISLATNRERQCSRTASPLLVSSHLTVLILAPNCIALLRGTFVSGVVFRGCILLPRLVPCAPWLAQAPSQRHRPELAAGQPTRLPVDKVSLFCFLSQTTTN